jgi:hypothetical protein
MPDNYPMLVYRSYQIVSLMQLHNATKQNVQVTERSIT